MLHTKEEHYVMNCFTMANINLCYCIAVHCQIVLTTIDKASHSHCFSHAVVAVAFEQAFYFVEESSLFLSYHVDIWGWLERAITVEITATDGSASRELLMPLSFWW